MAIQDGQLYKGYMSLKDITSNMTGQDWGVCIAVGLSLYLVYTYPWEDGDDDDDDTTPNQPLGV